MDISLCPLTAGNYQAAFRIQQSCHLYPWSQKVFADCLDGQYFAFQIEQQGQVIGYYIGLQVLDEITLMDIGVEREQRGKGYARTMMQHFIDQCENKCAQDVWLEVRRSNTAAEALYRQFGFELMEERKNYYPTQDGREDALLMKKSMGKSLLTTDSRR